MHPSAFAAVTLVLVTAVAPAQAEDDEADAMVGGVIPFASDVMTPVTEPSVIAHESGTASWYGAKFEGRKTASGERFSAHGFTAAHKALPFGTRVRVTVLDTLASVVVTINDRLPNASRHVIDVSRAAGAMLNMIARGTARVRVDILTRCPDVSPICA